MARKLKAAIDIDTARTNRRVRQLNKELGRTRTRARDAGKTGKEGMDTAAAATDKFRSQVVALGGSYVSLMALMRVITGIVQAYNQAIQLRGEFAAKGVGLMQGLAPMAAQFGLTGPQAVKIAGDIATRAGAGERAIPGVGDLMVMLQSAGLYPKGAITPAGIQPGAAGVTATLAQFAQYAGVAPEQQQTLGRIFAKGMVGRPLTQQAAKQTLGQLHAAFRASEAADWGQFFAGATGGVVGPLIGGIQFEPAVAQYAALVATTHRPMRAGEMSRMLYEQLLGADRPEIVQWIGPERYWRLKREDPTELQRTIYSRLAAVQGPARAQLFRRLKIAPELGARIDIMAGVLPQQQRIMGLMRARTGAQIGGMLAEWRRGPVAGYQAAETAAALAGAETGAGAVEAAGLRKLAEAERTRRERDQPIRHWISDALLSREAELRVGLVQYMQRAYREMYGIDMPVPGQAWQYDITGDRAVFPGAGGFGATLQQFLEAHPRYGPILRPGTVNIGVFHNHDKPADGKTPDRAEGAPSP